MFASLSESLVGVVSKFAAAAGAAKVFEEPCFFYRLDKAIEVKAGDKEGMRKLRREDAAVVDETWKYRSAQTSQCTREGTLARRTTPSARWRRSEVQGS